MWLVPMGKVAAAKAPKAPNKRLRQVGQSPYAINMSHQIMPPNKVDMFIGVELWHLFY